MDAFHSMKIYQQKHKVKLIKKPYKSRMSMVKKIMKVKTLMDFNHFIACSIKSLAILKTNEMKATSRFIHEKMLFEQISLASFIYDIIKSFAFPVQNVKDLYLKHRIVKFLSYLILTQNMQNSGSYSCAT